MNPISRRKLITGGLAAAAIGAAGIPVASRIGHHYGLIPPDHGVLYGAGETLTYAAQRLLNNHSLAREFSREHISEKPFSNGPGPKDDAFQKLKSNAFADWRLSIDGLVSNPASFSLADLKGHPRHSQITHLACEEGWSYIAEWTGVSLSHVLNLAGVRPNAKYVVYFSHEPGWWDSIDMADALHPQTVVSHTMNGADLPVAFGGPLRMRVPRQLGYKNVKHITRLTVTDTLKPFGKGLGSSAPEAGYAWYAGI